MVIILFFLLVAVWAAVLLPSVLNARRESPVNATTTPEPPAVRPSPPGPAEEVRRRVLARRKYALIALGAAALVTLVGAIVTGSFPLLIATLVFDVLLAAYVASLLQIKQRKGTEAPNPAEYGPQEHPPVKIVGG
jgi:hypothetical protein